MMMMMMVVWWTGSGPDLTIFITAPAVQQRGDRAAVRQQTRNVTVLPNGTGRRTTTTAGDQKKNKVSHHSALGLGLQVQLHHTEAWRRSGDGGEKTRSIRGEKMKDY